MVCDENSKPAPSKPPVDPEAGIVCFAEPEMLLCEIARIDIVDPVKTRRWLGNSGRLS